MSIIDHTATDKARTNSTDLNPPNSTPSPARPRKMSADSPEEEATHTHRGAFGPPQLAIRIGDGALLMAIDDHAHDRDLEGRDVVRLLVLTDEEAALARAKMDNAEHEAASAVAHALPKKRP